MTIDINSKIRDFLASAKALTQSLLMDQQAEQLLAVQNDLQAGGSMILEVAYPQHGVQRVALVLVTSSGARRELAHTEMIGARPWH